MTRSYRFTAPILFSAVLLSLFNISFPTVFAQAQGNPSQQVAGAATLGVAHMIIVKDKLIKDGTILTSTAKGAVPSATPYDSQVLGIVSRDAGIIISSTDDENSVPVIAEGAVYVLVSSKNGNIKKGDPITTSTIPGVGVKADTTGYILGGAMEDYTSNNATQVGKIAVNLSLHYFNSKTTLSGTLSDILKVALLPTKDSPSAIFKYVVAALVVLGSFVLGFLSFGRTAAKGVEALGRNPAASTVIHLGIIFNVVIVVTIIIAGIAVAFLILRL
jgi:F0F1-type ATP synthase membrane subunit c/vacuolar-type H+-ATPase subunit K